jgi:hypothetical protein
LINMPTPLFYFAIDMTLSMLIIAPTEDWLPIECIPLPKGR